MIRVFISSTFTDMSSERKVLLEKAYPEVLSFCRSLGLVFEVVDLRWGIRNVTSGDHDSCEVFLKEMENCCRISAGPAFVVSSLSLCPQVSSVWMSVCSCRSWWQVQMMEWWRCGVWLTSSWFTPEAVLHVQVIDSLSCCLSLAADGCLMRWSLINGQQLLCVQEAVPVDSTPSAVCLHLLDQNQLICVYTRTQVKLWKLDGAQLFSQTNEEDSVTLGVLDDSVFSLTQSGLVRIWSLLKRTPTVETELRTSKRLSTVVNSALAPKRGKVIVVTKMGFLYQISRQGKVSAVDFPLVPSFLCVTEDEKILMAACDQTLGLYNLDTDSLDNFLNLTHDDTVLSACLSSDGRQLFTGAADQLIRIWSVTTGALLDSLCGSQSPVSSLLLYKGSVVSASAAAPVIQLWNLKYDPDYKPIDHIPVGCAHVAVTRDCDQIFFVRHQSETEVISWNNHTGCISERLSVSAEVSCLEIAQNKRLLFCGLTSGTVLIYPLNIPQETLCIPPPESLCSVLSLAVSSKERHVAVAYEDAVCLFEITTRECFPTVEGPMQRVSLSLLQSPLSSMALLPDRRLLYGTSCGEVTLYDFRGGSSSALEPHHSRITCITASNWGKHALVGSEDAVQRLWSLSPVALDHTMEYKGFFFEGVLCAAFADSDQFVFTGSKDRTVKVWDVANGNLLLVQYVYSPVVRMLTYRNGFVALSQQGCVIREVFRCPEHISPDYNPLRNIKAQYRVTSRKRGEEDQCTPELQNYNPAQFNLNLMSMLGEKPSATCLIL